jgi:sterol desaturase/sphingolipid hydroxylase (fatty acid hydroxylase superfamily)
MMPWPLFVVAAAFALLALFELRWPARAARRGRWPRNLALGLVNGLGLRLLAGIGPFGAALWAQREGLGLLNLLALPLGLQIIIVVAAMDCAIYWQHRAMHNFAPLWTLHKLHHGDTDFDVTTGVRFHPGEALLSFIYKATLVLLLVAPPQAVIAFELWLTLGSLIEHGNIKLPERADHIIRRIWVTPAMHRIHHSAEAQDHNHNYGFALSGWDHLFGSYRACASGARIGLPAPDVR